MDTAAATKSSAHVVKAVRNGKSVRIMLQTTAFSGNRYQLYTPARDSSGTNSLFKDPMAGKYKPTQNSNNKKAVYMAATNDALPVSVATRPNATAETMHPMTSTLAGLKLGLKKLKTDDPTMQHIIIALKMRPQGGGGAPSTINVGVQLITKAYMLPSKQATTIPMTPTLHDDVMNLHAETNASMAVC
jgi:hypothetical protein